MLFSPAPPTTLAHNLKGSALSAHLDRRTHKVRSSATALSKLGWFGTLHHPESEAVSFYLLNHAVSTISARFDAMEPLPQAELEVVQRYISRGSTTAARLYYYVLLITAREARHNQTASSSGISKVTPFMKEAYPDIDSSTIDALYSFLKGFADSSSSALNQMSQAADSWQLGHIVRMMQAVYYKCSWGSSFGGKKWGNIADALYRMVTGEWSAEMFADTAFTLAHNTAPIFNKGMLYHSAGSGLIKILDCQRAGQIPQLVAEGSAKGMDDDINFIQQRMPGFISGAVDWYKVQELGAVGHYVAAKPKPPKPPKPVTPPPGCSTTEIEIDHVTKVHVLLERTEA